MKLVYSLVLVYLLAIYSAFTWGYITHTYYQWFILPHFHLPTFTYYQFVGFTLFVGVMTRRPSTIPSDDAIDMSATWFYSIIGPWLTLLCGWLFYTYFLN